MTTAAAAHVGEIKGHFYARRPKPGPYETNATEKATTMDPQTREKVIEDRPVPETHPGGLYKNADDEWVDAEGRVFTQEQLEAVWGPEHMESTSEEADNGR